MCFEQQTYLLRRSLFQGWFPTQAFLVFVIILHYGELLITKTVQIFSQGIQLSMGNSSNILCHELALTLLIKATVSFWQREALKHVSLQVR